MNGIIIILIIISLLYYIYQKFRLTIYDKFSYKLGVLQNDYNIKKYGFLLKKLIKVKIEIVIYEDYDILMSELNNNTIDFGITYENYFIDSILGLNKYENQLYNNLEFCTGLYFNYFQFISNIYNKDDQLVTNFTKFTELIEFKEKYKRNYILGTENINTISFTNMFILLVTFGYSPIDYTTYDENIDYDKKVIFYYIDTEENLQNKILNDNIDGLLLFRTFNDKIITNITKEKDIVFLDIDFKETYFDDLFSMYYYKNDNILIGVDDFDDLKDKIGFETRMSRVLLITNKHVNEDLVYKFTKAVYGHNNYLTNVLTNSTNTLATPHNYFKPIQLAYINKNIPIHIGSKKYLKELGFIIEKDNTKDKNDIENKDYIKNLNLYNNEKFKCYWKYKKIGLNNFIL